MLVQGRPWSCERCHAEYDRQAIEALIIDSVQRRIVSYQLQDFKCQRCKAMRADSLSMHCVCSGEYVGSQQKQDLLRRLGVVQNVAEWHQLPLLESVVADVKRQIV